jgi:ATP-dependent DNA helicase RecQ
MPDAPATPESILHSVFGYDRFRPHQREIIDDLLAGRDVLAIMPTGGGKSLCFQVPALLRPRLTVVVSPLIALMQDQVDQMHALGVPAVALNSMLSADQYRAHVAAVRTGWARLLYVAPETLLMPQTLDLLDAVGVDGLAIDEAHCISEWGHDFRPEYRQLRAVRQRFPNANCLALTATATPRVRDDIAAALGLADCSRYVASFNRENLFLEVVPKVDPSRQLLDFLDRYKGEPGIVYAFSRKQVDTLAALLARAGHAALPYHAGLTDVERRTNQAAFVRDDAQVIVATIAFGMGINKPNVRFVVHHDLPKSLESYYQEVGRAGRDGLPAHCQLLYSDADVQKLRYFIDQKDDAERRSALAHLDAMVRYAEHEAGCRRVPLLAYFGEHHPADGCPMCDRCVEPSRPECDVTIPAQKFLSCVVRTGERFGAGHVADVLLGSRNEKVLQYQHDQLSTHGIGRELERKQWLHLGRQLVAKGLLQASDPPYNTLSLTPHGRDVLRKREPILGRLLAAPRSAKEPRARRGSPAADAPDHDPDLFERLRRLRKQLADEANVPPYVVFSDRTLIELAAHRPATPAALLAIHGVGQVKADRYGAAFLEAIREYSGRPSDVSAPRTAPLSPSALSETMADEFHAGASPTEIADRHQVRLATIVKRLTRFVTRGGRLRDPDRLLQDSGVPAPLIEAAHLAFEELGTSSLSPIYERLGGALAWDDLHLLRLHYLASKPSPPANRSHSR